MTTHLTKLLTWTLILILIQSASAQVLIASINCGQNESYEDENSIKWSGDSDYTKAGNASQVRTKISDHVMNTLRAFTDGGDQDCYNVNSVGVGRKVLVRASFYYGNYDGKDVPPTFIIRFDGNYWTVVRTASDHVVSHEVIYVTKRSSISICVTQNRLLEFPFISALEVRGLETSMYADMPGAEEPIHILARIAYGLTKPMIRYPDDPYDRIWTPERNDSGLIEVVNSATFGQVSSTVDRPPPSVLKHAYTLRNLGNGSRIVLSPRLPPDYSTGGFIVNCYFSEVEQLGANGNRSFTVFLGNESMGTVSPPYRNYTQLRKAFDYSSNITLILVPTDDSTLPPLINAIEVFRIGFASNSTSNINGVNRSSSSLGLGAIIGIVLAFVAVSILLVMVGVFWWKDYKKRKDTLEYELKGVDLETSSFTYRQIKAATKNFDAQNKIGEGGFGPVYMGTLSDGTAIAVKQLSAKSRQGNREFVTEIGMISSLQHPHLVKLHGCCIDGNNLLLIYEYMENNSLARVLFGRQDPKFKLDWPTRKRICVGVAKGLAYLHDSRLKIVHRDIKASNVLLDGNFVPKISDFGLARLHDEDATHISTRIAGTTGYMAPEYAMQGRLTEKADVYSFGVVLLEVLSGRINNSNKPGEEFNLLEQAIYMYENGTLLELVDPRMESMYKKEEIMAAFKVALLCTNTISTERPSMSTVVSMLEGSTSVSDPASLVSINAEKKRNSGKAMKLLLEQEDQNVSVDAPCTGSSEATADLYNVVPDSEYLMERDFTPSGAPF